jgi:hypothetical protein
LILNHRLCKNRSTCEFCIDPLIFSI